uniref:Filamin-A n=1 Tax=Heterorhabditis bacteriophora TaxID=37862 RepID=A0A1I7X867_HETBA
MNYCILEVHVFTPDGDNTRIIIKNPSGHVVEAVIESTETGFRVRFTPSEIGDYTIDVTYQDLPIESSLYLLHSVPNNGDGCTAEAESSPPRADLVIVTGPGLGPVIAKRSTHVLIDTTCAGFGDIDLFVDGPTRTPIHCVDNHDGTLTMYYVPKTLGLYWLRVMFDNEHVPGSPFQVMIPFMLTLLPEVEPNNVRLTDTNGGGSIMIFEPKDVIVSMDAIIMVDASDCGNISSVRAEVVGPDGISRECTLSAFSSDNKFELRWNTDVIGDYVAKVYINGIKVDQEAKVRAKEMVGKEDIDETSKLLKSHMIVGEKRSVSYIRHEGLEVLHLTVIPKIPDAVEFCKYLLKYNNAYYFFLIIFLGLESEPFFPDRIRDIITFRPTKPGPNVLQLYYGGEKFDNIEYVVVSADQLCTIPEDPIEHSYANILSLKFNFDPSFVDSRILKAFVTMPSKQTDQAEIIDNHDGAKEVRDSPFTVLVVYTMEFIVTHDFRALIFLLQVDKSQVGDASKVEVSGSGKSKAICLHDNEILIDTSKAVSDSLLGKFHSPLTVQCTGKGAGRVQQLISRKAEQCYRFRPVVEGPHALSIMHKDAHVNGSPFQFTVGQFSEGGAHKVKALLVTKKNIYIYIYIHIILDGQSLHSRNTRRCSNERFSLPFAHYYAAIKYND